MDGQHSLRARGGAATTPEMLEMLFTDTNSAAILLFSEAVLNIS